MIREFVTLVAQLVKNLPVMRETWIWSLGWEDPLEKGKVPIPVFWPGEFHGLNSPWGRKESDMTEQLSLSFSRPYMTTGKSIALTIRTFVGKVTSLLFNMLSRLVIAFLLRRKHLLISWMWSPSAVTFGAQENKLHYCFHCFPIYLPWSDGTGCHNLSFLNVEC